MPSIAFIFAHRETDKWNTPLAVVEEFKSRGWDTSIYSLFDSNDNYVDDNVYELLKTTPDVVMHMDWGRHLSPVLSKLRSTGAYCIMEAGDDPQNFERNAVKGPWFDLILSPDIRAVKQYKELGYNAEWWTHFADTRIYQEMDIEEKYIAVSSRGGGSSQILDTLADHYEGDIINKNGWEGTEHTEFLNSGKIIIQHSRWGEITRRIFEGMACGKLVITDRLNEEVELDSLFIDGENIILYDDIQDCAEKIAYYNNNPMERNEIARNGYQKVLNNHTQTQRVDFIIQKWENMEKSITKKYNFKVKYNQFGKLVDQHFVDTDELILIEKFENIVLDLKEKNLQTYSMLELGSNQAWYSLLFKSMLKNKNVTSIMVEPYDPYMVRGVEHFNINNYEGHFLNESIGGRWIAHNMGFDKPITNIDKIIQEYNLDSLTVLHSDIDGAEISMLEGSDWALTNKKIEYAFVLTHGLETHLKCLDIISKYDYEILLDHREDNIGADRLIIAKSK